jgi:hypothetical protein
MGKTIEVIEDLGEDAKDVIKWVAAGYKYLDDFMKVFSKAQNEDPKDALKDLKRGLKIFRWVGRAERRIEQKEKLTMEDLKEIGSIGLPENLKKKDEDLIRELNPFMAKLVEAFSRYRGKLKKEHDQLIVKEAVLLRATSKDPSKVEAIHADVNKLFNEEKTMIADLEKWMVGTQELFKRIIDFDLTLEKLAKI